MNNKEKTYTVAFNYKGQKKEISYVAKNEADARSKFPLKVAHAVSNIDGAVITLIYRKVGS